MEKNNTSLRSVWGKWWEPVRKWFYPLWLAYETSIRFLDYAWSVHNYISQHEELIACYIGGFGTFLLGAVCSVATWVFCSVFLTVPGCFALYRFFSSDTSGTPFEHKLKTLF